MHITEIVSEYLPPLGRFDLYCHEQVNLFVGPNASGKSTILRGIEALHSLALSGSSPPSRGTEAGRVTNGSDTGMLYLNYPSVEEGPIFAMGASDDWPRDDSGSVVWNAVPFLYIPAVRVNLPGMDIFGQTIKEPGDMDADTPPKQLYGIYSDVFSARELELVIDTFREKRGHQSRRSLQMALHLGYTCARSICPEVISDHAPYPYVEERDYGLFTSETIVHHDMGIGTSDASVSSPLYAGVLSSGTQGTLLWVWALAIKIASHYNWIEGWEKKPTILLIDEIENHLHPTWQRRVIPALLEHFPGLQIFATTHSPFVVAGLKAGQVHLLKRDENGVVTALHKHRGHRGLDRRRDTAQPDGC